jgi:hypothetical protein
MPPTRVCIFRSTRTRTQTLLHPSHLCRHRPRKRAHSRRRSGQQARQGGRGGRARARGRREKRRRRDGQGRRLGRRRRLRGGLAGRRVGVQRRQRPGPARWRHGGGCVCSREGHASENQNCVFVAEGRHTGEKKRKKTTALVRDSLTHTTPFHTPMPPKAKAGPSAEVRAVGLAVCCAARANRRACCDDRARMRASEAKEQPSPRQRAVPTAPLATLGIRMSEHREHAPREVGTHAR